MDARILLVTLLAVSGVHLQCLTPDDAAQAHGDPNARLDLYTGEQEFSIAMLREVVAANPKSNVFFSPHSTYHALLLAYFGAANHTETALKAALRLPATQNKMTTMQAYRFEKYFQAMREVNGSESYELRSANRIFVSDRVTLRDCMKDLFVNELQVEDFTKDPEAVRAKINEWVEVQTKRHIKDLIPEGKISAQSNLVLVNAAYFKGLWQSQFLPENTRKEVFYISHSKQTLVDMMKQKGTFNHIVSERLGAHVLELPYKGHEVSMFILLPPFAKTNGVEAVIKQLTVESLQEIVEDDLPRSVEVSIPKFSIEQTIELTPILERLGVGDLFQNTADLSGFTGKRDLSLDEARHKAKIEVDEQGTVAAAATAIFSFRSSRPLAPSRFVANYPFVYLLFDKASRSVLFMGVYRSPHNKN